VLVSSENVLVSSENVLVSSENVRVSSENVPVLRWNDGVMRAIALVKFLGECYAIALPTLNTSLILHI
ncbi:MAG: hypothetical protein ACR2LR_29150, partial [Hassallia sp.]